MGIYVDTSALIKRYVHERTSHDFEVFLGAESEDLVISPLGLTEFESMLNRRLRRRDFDHAYLERSRDLLPQLARPRVVTAASPTPSSAPR